MAINLEIVLFCTFTLAVLSCDIYAQVIIFFKQANSDDS